ncbi:glycosyltransferase, partial [Haloarcula sp. AONF1]
MKKLTSEGENVIFLTTEPDDREHLIREAGATIEYTGNPSETGKPWSKLTQPYWKLRRCMECAEKHDVDVVHALWIDQSGVQFLLSLTKNDPQRAVFGTIFNPRHFNKNTSLLKRAFRMINRWSLNRLLSSDKLSTLFIHSPKFKSQLVSYGVEPSRICVIPDPVEVPDERPSKKECRKQLDIPEKDLVLLFFGGFRH